MAAIGVEMKNELTERNEARSKEKLSKSQIAKDLLNLSNSTGRGTSSSLDHKKKNKRYHLKKPGEMILEENGKKIKKGISTEKSLSLEKKKSQKSKTRFSDNEESDKEGKIKKPIKGKKDDDDDKKNKIKENQKGNKKDDSDDEKKGEIKKKTTIKKEEEDNLKKPAPKPDEEKKTEKNKKEEKKKEEKKKK